MGRSEIILKYKYHFILYVVLFLLLQIPLAGLKAPLEREGWISDGAYHLNKDLTGKMAIDLPYGEGWIGSGLGKSFFLIHFLFYKIFGVGLLQARMVTLLFGILILLLLFYWTCRNISFEVGVLATILLTVSFSFWPFLPFASQDMVHCFFGLLSFCLLHNAIFHKKDVFYFLAGFLSALSVENSYRGIEIVMIVYVVHAIYFDRKTFFKNSGLLLAGSVAAFILWFFNNIMPNGLDNFIQHRLISTSSVADPRNLQKIFSEFIRFFAYMKNQRNLPVIEIVLITFLIINFIKNRLYENNRESKFILNWVLSTFLVMSIIEPNHSPSYILMYTTYILILCSMSLNELLNRRKAAMVFLLFILASGMSYQVGRIIIYSYQQYYKTGYGMKGYFERLRKNVDLDKNIFGNVHYWYAFPDAQYYGGGFYLQRVITVLREINFSNEYENEDEKNKAILSFFKKRKIEYLIADHSLKHRIAKYFQNNRLPAKNFQIVNKIHNNFLNCGSRPKGTHCNIEAYKIISYEP